MAKKDVTSHLYDFQRKDDALRDYVNYDLNRTSQMFKYDNLPVNIDPIRMELSLQTHGYGCILHLDESEMKHDEPFVHKLESGVYVLWGGVGGILDFNQDFTKITIAHPLLRQSKELTIGEDCVLLRNDTLMNGLLPLLERYNSLLVENDLTIKIATIQSRILSLITAGSDTGYSSAVEFLKKIDKGDLGIIHDNGFDIDSQIKALPYSGTANNMLTNLIELEQYLKASKLNDLGLTANYNMKRESINSTEAQLGQDSLLPLIDDMLHCREKAWNEANEMFGLDVKVQLHSGWEQLHEEIANTEGLDYVNGNHIDENVNQTNNKVGQSEEKLTELIDKQQARRMNISMRGKE